MESDNSTRTKFIVANGWCCCFNFFQVKQKNDSKSKENSRTKGFVEGKPFFNGTLHLCTLASFELVILKCFSPKKCKNMSLPNTVTLHLQVVFYTMCKRISPTCFNKSLEFKRSTKLICSVPLNILAHGIKYYLQT